MQLNEKDLYVRMKELEAQLETLNIQEEYIKDEQKNLKRELLRAQEEVKRIQSVPLVIGQFLEMIDPTTGIVGSTTGEFSFITHHYLIEQKLIIMGRIKLLCAYFEYH